MRRCASCSAAHKITTSSAKRYRVASPSSRGFTTCSNHASRMTWRKTFAKMGATSPPTKLQTFFFGVVITRIWIDPKYDIDLVTRDFHPLDQRADEVALARPVRRLQPVVEFGG